MNLPPGLRVYQQDPWVQWLGPPALVAFFVFFHAMWEAANHDISKFSVAVFVIGINAVINKIMGLGVASYWIGRGFGHTANSDSFAIDGTPTLAPVAKVMADRAVLVKQAATDDHQPLVGKERIHETDEAMKRASDAMADQSNFLANVMASAGLKGA